MQQQYHSLFLASGILFLSSSIHALPAEDFVQPVIQESYSGGFMNDYLQELPRVKTLLEVAEQNVSTQLAFDKGFIHPVTIRFADGAPAYIENPFFYIQRKASTHEFSQELVVNVEAFAERHRRDVNRTDAYLRSGFYYAMAELMLNDQMGDTSNTDLPLWVLEGTAVFLSGSGDYIVKEVVAGIPRSHIRELVSDLNQTYPYLSKRQWARYYLAIQYIFSRGGVTNLQNFIHSLMDGKSVSETVLSVFGEPWPTFDTKEASNAYNAFLSFAPADEQSPADEIHEKSW